MKQYFIFVFLLLIAVCSYSQTYWQRVPSPTTKSISDCFFLDTTYGWAIGDSGLILHTSNSGQNWIVQNSGISTFAMDDIFFINNNTGWALANDFLFFGTVILRTSNGGANWTFSRYSDTTLVLNVVHFLNEQTGYLTGYTGGILKTTNGGNNWITCRIDTAFCQYLYLFPKRQIDFLNAQTGFACGGQIDIQGIVWRTTDAGANWYTYCVTPEPMEDIEVISADRIISVGGDFEYGAMTALTFDTGNNWIYNPTNVFGVARCIAFRTPSEAWCPLTFGQKWIVNLDSGSTSSQWIEVPTPDSLLVNATDFRSPTFGWSFGTNGSILKYNKDVIGLSDPSNNVPVKHKLYQNYPNPFNPATTISYELSKPEFVKVTLYDLTGRQVKVIIEGMRPQGYNRVKFNGMELASGIYIYKLEAGSFVETKKMAIVK